MTEKILFSYTDGFTGAVGDGVAPYTEEEFRGYNDAFLNGDNEDMGVVSRVSGELEVSTTVLSPGSPDTVQVEAGRAIVHGFPYYNDAIVDLGAPSGSGNRAGYVIIRVNRTSANSPPNEDEGRLRFLMSVDMTPPTFTQISATTWDIPLALFYVDGADGAIYPTSSLSGTKGVTDSRNRAITPLSQMLLIGSLKLTSDIAAPITFANIPPLYNNLRLVCSVRSDDAGTNDSLKINFNNRTLSGNYDYLEFAFSDPAGLTTGATSGFDRILIAIIADGGVANETSPVIMEIPAYKGLIFEKSGEARSGYKAGAASTTWARFVYHWWFNQTEAINEIDLGLQNGTNFKAGSEFYLYGY